MPSVLGTILNGLRALTAPEGRPILPLAVRKIMGLEDTPSCSVFEQTFFATMGDQLCKLYPKVPGSEYQLNDASAVVSLDAREEVQVAQVFRTPYNNLAGAAFRLYAEGAPFSYFPPGNGINPYESPQRSGWVDKPEVYDSSPAGGPYNDGATANAAGSTALSSAAHGPFTAADIGKFILVLQDATNLAAGIYQIAADGAGAAILSERTGGSIYWSLHPFAGADVGVEFEMWDYPIQARWQPFAARFRDVPPNTVTRAVKGGRPCVQIQGGAECLPAVARIIAVGAPPGTGVGGLFPAAGNSDIQLVGAYPLDDYYNGRLLRAYDPSGNGGYTTDWPSEQFSSDEGQVVDYNGATQVLTVTGDMSVVGKFNGKTFFHDFFPVDPVIYPDIFGELTFPDLAIDIYLDDDADQMDQLDQITLLLIALAADGSDDDKIKYDYERSQQIAPFSIHPQGNGWYTYFFPAREIAAASTAFTRRLVTFGVARLNNAATALFYVGNVRWVTRPGAMRLRLAPNAPNTLGAYLPVDRSGANRFWLPLSNGWHTYKFDSSWGLVNPPLTVDGTYSLVLDWLYSPMASYQAIHLLGNAGSDYASGSAWEKRPNWEALNSDLWFLTWVNTDLVVRDVRVGLVADIPPSLLNPTSRQYSENAGALSPIVVANNQGQLGWNLVGELVALDADGNLLYEAQHHMSRPGVDQGSSNGWLAQHGEKPLDVRLPAGSHFQLTNVHGNNSQGLTSGWGHGGVGAYFKNAALGYLSARAYPGGVPTPPFDTEYQLKLIDTMWNPLWSQYHNFSNVGITLRATCFYTHPRTWREAEVPV